jgi:ABC-type branched-subunit amino acid transport system ATPase component
VTVDGRRVPLGRPGRSRAAGILRTFQTPQVYDSLSCLENVMLSMRPRRWMGLSGAVLARPHMLRAERQRRADARAVLERIGIGGLADSPADGLSYGQRRILELARAWAGHPQVLLLDEPSSGLNDEETRDVGKILAGFRSDGMTLLVVDHKIDFVSALCDRVAVLSLGSVIAEGEPADVWENRDVIDAYLGVEGA